MDHEKIGDNLYYIVQAVPHTKAKKLYVVSAFIGVKGYKKEAPQFINAKSPDATSLNETVKTSNNTISKSNENVKIKLSLQKSTDAERVRDSLIKQNKNLRVANMILKQELVQTNGNMLSYKDAVAIAKDITKTFRSSYDVDALTEDIYNSFKWFDGENPEPVIYKKR